MFWCRACSLSVFLKVSYITSTDSSPKTLVIGGTGTTGSRVVDRLKAARVPVRAVSRSNDPTLSRDDQSTWPAVFEGIEKMYLVHPVPIALLF